MAAEGSGVRPAVVDADTGDFLGWLTLNGYDPTHRSASLGFCFVERAWGRGVATEAAGALPAAPEAAASCGRSWT